jgi:hypothetical protein
MPVAIDTRVLISAEKQGDFDTLLPKSEEGPYSWMLRTCLFRLAVRRSKAI